MQHELFKKWQENKESYKVSEIGSGTMWFVKEVLDSYFWLREQAKFSHAKDLFGNDLLDHIYTHEGKKRLWDKARWDFMLKMNWKKIVVEVEAYQSIEKWMKQIDGYMAAESTIYWIVTDGWEWRFFNEWDSTKWFKSLTLEELLSEKGKAFLDNYYNTYDYYLNRLKTLKTTAFDLQPFHIWLITIAEAVVSDFRHMWLFDSNASQEKEKVEIQTAYCLIIQFLLIKIIQNKRDNKVQLINVKKIIQHLEDKNRQGIFEEALTQIEWLGHFYESYHNQQESLIQTIIEKYKTKFWLTQLTLDAVRPFLDLYQFIFSFDFKDVKQDLFGAVYENYLKELYKNDDTKKWQVFTPPEIVEFMLDEIWYTTEYIKERIEHYWLENVKQELDEKWMFNIEWLSLIDPACGSWTFLYKWAWRILWAIYKLRKENKLTDLQAWWLSESLIVNNIVWFDIEAFPLYLAEMNILQTLLFFNIDPQTGKILNMINKPIKIFSTQDSISEFSDLESSMMQDLEQIVLNEWFENSLFTKRDNATIFNLKADIQQFDPDAFIQKIEFQLACKELESPVYVLTDKNLITKKTKTFWDTYGKSLMKNVDSLSNLKKYLKENHELVHEQFKKRWKTQAPRIEAMKKKVAELVGKQTTKRMKFDFVIANPPYVKGEIKYDSKDIFWININDPKYAQIHLSNWDKLKIWNSQFNIYWYFYYLWFYLLKKDALLCYITPRTILQQPSFHKLRQYIKKNLQIESIYDFGLWSLFYERGLSQSIHVATDSTILKISKRKPETDKPIKYMKYLWESGNITLDQFRGNSNSEKLNYQHIFEFKGYLFYEYFKQIQDESWWDFHMSIYPRVEIGWKQNKRNLDWLWYIIFKLLWYVTLKNKLPQEFYDYDNLGALQDRPTCKIMVSKKYKLTRSSTSWRQRRNLFSFTDYKFIHNRNAFTSIWINDRENLPELYYLFGLLNSQSIQEQLDEKFNRICNMTNLQMLEVPRINSKEASQLKNELVQNSEAIITLCKNSEQHVTHRSDITTTKLNIDKGIEEIVWLKPEYAQILWKDFSLPVGIQPTDSLSEKIVDEIWETSLELKKLEDERDEIVKKLYDLDR